MKKNAKVLAIIASVTVLFTVAIVVFFNARNTPAIPIEQSETEFNLESESVIVEPAKIEVKEIKPAETKDVIPEQSETDTLPPPSVTETKTESGDTVQQPNWEAQKELKSGTDLEDPDYEPEYVGSPAKPPVVHEESKTTSESSTASSSATTVSKSTSSTSGTPQNGDTKTIDGKRYDYLEGFGWIEYGGGNKGETIEAPTTGNIVGY